MLQTEDLTGVDEDLALRLLAVARSIAPGIDDLTGDARKTAVAVVRDAAKDAVGSSRTISSQRIGSAGVNYVALSSAFSDENRAILRNLCGLDTATASAPVGHFPRPTLIGRLWPEQYDD